MLENHPDVVPRLAASMLVARDDPFEVLMIKRNDKMKFAGGSYAFPGGKVHEGDRDPAWAGHTIGWEAFDDLQREIRIAGVREVFEETGMVLAQRADCAPLATFDNALALRRAVETDAVPFLDVIRRLHARIDLHAMAEIAHWITPPGGTMRFDTWFLVAKARRDQTAVVDGSETVSLEWVVPGEMWRLGQSGARLMWPPTWLNLKRIADASNVDEALAQSRALQIVPAVMRLETRASGQFWVLPPEAGYGYYEEPLDMSQIPTKAQQVTRD
jgi:8-oxo-dGTP pyrophosphatase MutT (NUDIX family)